MRKVLVKKVDLKPVNSLSFVEAMRLASSFVNVPLFNDLSDWDWRPRNKVLISPVSFQMRLSVYKEEDVEGII